MKTLEEKIQETIVQNFTYVSFGNDDLGLPITQREFVNGELANYDWVD